MPFDGNMTEQRANLERLALMLENSDSFDMADVFHACGTPACIHGHALKLFNIEESDDDEMDEVREVAGMTGLSVKGLESLCFAWVAYGGLTSDQITGRIAAAALRRLADTGEARFDLADA